MDDLISRQDAIEAVMALPDCPNGFSDTYDKSQIIGVLEEVPSAQPEQRWIPCNWQKENECLPDECKSVLICIEDKTGMYLAVSYRTDYNRWEKYGRDVNVTAWMPLPEPYKGDES